MVKVLVDTGAVRARFEDLNFEAMGVPKEQRQAWVDCRDCLPNLQLMEGKQNSAKNATPFKQWFEGMSEAHRWSFSKSNYLPDDVGLEFERFIEFYQRRKDALRAELKKVLAMSDAATRDDSVWSGRNDEIEEYGEISE